MLIYHSPNSETVTTILRAKRARLQPLSQLELEVDDDELEADFFQLLQGDGEMPCPLLGSGYLDPENTLFGRSTLDFRTFLTGWDPVQSKASVIMLHCCLPIHLMPFAPSMLASMENMRAPTFTWL